VCGRCTDWIEMLRRSSLEYSCCKSSEKWLISCTSAVIAGKTPLHTW
jgi:hypothetical protein